MSIKTVIQGEFLEIQKWNDDSKVVPAYNSMIVCLSDLERDERIKLAAWALQQEEV